MKLKGERENYDNRLKKNEKNNKKRKRYSNKKKI